VNTTGGAIAAQHGVQCLLVKFLQVCAEQENSLSLHVSTENSQIQIGLSDIDIFLAKLMLIQRKVEESWAQSLCSTTTCF
jgi:hypothetical protein